MTDEQKQPPIHKIKILIAVPSRGEWQQGMSLSLAFMMHTLSQNQLVRLGDKNCILLWNVMAINTSILPQSRQNAVDAAVRNDVDFLLFIDDDMTFPETLLHEWINEDRPVIAANCPTRGVPCNPTARHKSSTPAGRMIYSDLANMRTERVWRVGTGIMLLRKDALRSLPRPAFTPRWDEERDAYVGEDWVMCEHLEAAGIDIWIDHKISEQIGHVGAMEYTWGHVKATRMAEAGQRSTVATLASDDHSEQAEGGIVIARG
jgi:hypothetical protein